MYSREERTRLTGEINYMSAFIPGAERYFRRSLHVKNCRDRLIILSRFQEKGGSLLIRACSAVITSNTVCVIIVCLKERTIEMHKLVKISGMCFSARCKLNGVQIMRCRYLKVLCFKPDDTVLVIYEIASVFRC